MGDDQDVFRRVEKKYLLTSMQYALVMRQLMACGMKPDDYGKHTISNIYYDAEDYALIRASLEKPIYKEKLRLRAYGVPTMEGKAFVEIKKKFKGVVYKRRVALPLRQCIEGLEQGSMPLKAGQIGREIDAMNARYDLSPKVMLCYDREAMYHRSTPELRITFDEDIRFREDELDLTQGSSGWLILPRGRRLMEVKLPGVMPIWLARLFEENGVRETSFSKYGMVYRQYLMNATKKELMQSA